MNYIYLILGFILLIKGADFFVTGSSSLARYFKIPTIIIGLTIVAFGTSSPEAAVSISAAIKGTEGISVGNVIGSNLINISLIIGITAIISPLKVKKPTIIKEIPFSLLGGIVLLILLADHILQNQNSNVLSQADGLILIAFFSIFIYYIVEVAIKNQKNNLPIIEPSESSISKKDHIPLKKTILITILGFLGIVFGGWVVVDNAQVIAASLGMSETLVGLTIVAFGTSLPELITSVVAAIKKESEIALGNIVGSNIFNIFFVLGVSATVTPLNVDPMVLFDIVLMIFVTFILLIFSTTHHRQINRFEGILLSLLYSAYLFYIILRN